MSLLLKEKQKHEDKEEAKKIILPFSYNVARPLFRRSKFLHSFIWTVIEKGSENSEQKYMISYSKIRSVMFELGKYILKPKYYKSRLFRNLDFNIYLMEEKKCQSYEYCSVKERGMIYTLLQLSNEQKRKGVITISTGSFGYLLCCHGKKFEIPITVVMPISTAEETVRMYQSQAGSLVTVLVKGSDIVEAHNIALYIAKAKGLFYLDRNDHPNIIIGQATFGINIVEQMPRIDAVVLPTPIDGCGLTTGIAMAIKGLNPKIEVIEVQTQTPDFLIQRIRRHTTSCQELEIPVKDYVWHSTLNLVNKVIDNLVIVNEKSVSLAANLLQAENITDSYAAIGLAAILTNQLNMLKKKSVLIPLFGNMD